MPTVRTKMGATKAEARVLIGWRDLLEAMDDFVTDCAPGELVEADADWLEAVAGIIRTRIRQAGDRGT